MEHLKLVKMDKYAREIRSERRRDDLERGVVIPSR